MNRWMDGSLLFAQAVAAAKERDWMALPITLGLLALAILIFAGIVKVVKSWYEGTQISDTPSAEMIAEFRALKAKGMLSGEELARISRSLGADIGAMPSRKKKETPPRRKPAPTARAEAGVDAEVDADATEQMSLDPQDRPTRAGDGGDDAGQQGDMAGDEGDGG